MTHECMNADGVMETVGRDSAWGVYVDNGRSPTLDRVCVVVGNDEAQDWAAHLRHQGKHDVRVVQVCLGETPTMGIWKVCGGRVAIEPNRESAGGGVQVGRP